MKVSATIRKETGHIALGILLGDAVMLGIFAALKQLDLTVWLGTLLGSAAAIWNFLWMGLSAQKAMNNPDRAQIIMHLSYTQRTLFVVAIMIVGFAAPWFHVIAVVVPFLLPSVTIKLMQLLGLYRPEKKGGEKA